MRTSHPPPRASRPPQRVSSASWFAANPSKAYYEKLSLIWAPLSMLALLVGVFGTPLHKFCDRNSYLTISVAGCLPGFLVPLLYPCKADIGRPYAQRFWVKGSLWIAIFGFYGNYFWTHYFYQLLGAQYLFDSYRFNDVPVVTFTATFFYFTFYFNLVTLVLRRLSHLIRDLPSFPRAVLWAANIAALSYATAVFEAVSIQHFPLYTYTERHAFMLVGSIVYGLYFIVGFPMFFSLDEGCVRNTRTTSGPAPLSLSAVAVSALAASALVTLLLDLWRLTLGSIYELGSGAVTPVPFIYQQPTATCPAVPPCVPTRAESAGECVRMAEGCAREAASWAKKSMTGLSRVVRGGVEEAAERTGLAAG